ncbi:hypothetical protein DFH27DRAFT_160515 [Peziza echinospora]|nr:hypothetical protein DFH27DRAFT_160515 [Peziza echinospora]
MYELSVWVILYMITGPHAHTDPWQRGSSNLARRDPSLQEQSRRGGYVCHFRVESWNPWISKSVMPALLYAVHGCFSRALHAFSSRGSCWCRCKSFEVARRGVASVVSLQVRKRGPRGALLAVCQLCVRACVRAYAAVGGSQLCRVRFVSPAPPPPLLPQGHHHSTTHTHPHSFGGTNLSRVSTNHKHTRSSTLGTHFSTEAYLQPRTAASNLLSQAQGTLRAVRSSGKGCFRRREPVPTPSYHRSHLLASNLVFVAPYPQTHHTRSPSLLQGTV